MKSAVLPLCFALISFAVHSFADTPPPSPGVNHEKKDATGRLLRRVTFHPDGGITHVALTYGAEAEKLTLEAELDSRRETVRTYREKVDRRGRPVEREEMTTTNGRKVTRKTKFTYDAAGVPTAETLVIE